MRKTAVIAGILCFALAASAGFKVKSIKPKKPEQFQSRVTLAGVTYAADLLLDGKEQKEYFYKELASSNLIVVRLAVFNKGNEDVVLPLDTIHLLTPNGDALAVAAPETVAEAVLKGMAVPAQAKANAPPITVGPANSGDPRTDPSDPRYDPTLDPNSPRYDPNDPRNRGQYPRAYPPVYSPGTYPPSTYPSGGTLGRPGVVLNPGGGGDLSKFEAELAEKDFSDKAHTNEPVLSSMIRDKFLYFSVKAQQTSTKGYVLRMPVSKGIPQEVDIKF